MKKLRILWLVLALIVISCAEDSISKQEKRAEKEKKNTELVQDNEPISLSIDSNSYWFVVVEKKDGTQKMNTCVKQEHRYFSSKELKATFKDDVFILNIIQVSKETYENN